MMNDDDHTHVRTHTHSQCCVLFVLDCRLYQLEVDMVPKMTSKSHVICHIKDVIFRVHVEKEVQCGQILTVHNTKNIFRL